ncbi:MAG: hypothetical protein HY326_12025 [Chloroflexi bacterium]|nr:hypothetical protein [Chloroflexota bacterium]
MSYVYNRLSVLISLVLLGLVLISLADIRPPDLVSTESSAQLLLNTGVRGLMILVLLALVCVGLDGALRNLPNFQTAPWYGTMHYWPLPMMLVLAFALLLPYAPGLIPWILASIIAAISIALTFLAEVYIATGQESWKRWAHVWLKGAGFVVAFLLLGLIYGTRMRGLFTGSMIFIVVALLSASELRDYRTSQHVFWYALGIGLILGQITWALNYLPLSRWGGAAILFVHYYSLVGLADYHLSGRLTLRVALEYATLALVAVIILMRVVPGLR